MTNTLASLIVTALVALESADNPRAYNPGDDAVGWCQITPVYLREVNRILGYRKYRMSDRWDASKSLEMSLIFLGHWCDKRRHGRELTPREILLVHRYGPTGWLKHKHDHRWGW